MPTSMKGGAGKAPVPRVPRAQKQASIRGAVMGLPPHEVNPYTWLSPPTPKVPRSVVMINQPSHLPTGRRSVRLENNQYRASLAYPLNVPMKFNGKTEGSMDYLLRTLT